jgi:hypothetical protein
MKAVYRVYFFAIDAAGGLGVEIERAALMILKD